MTSNPPTKNVTSKSDTTFEKSHIFEDKPKETELNALRTGAVINKTKKQRRGSSPKTPKIQQKNHLNHNFPHYALTSSNNEEDDDEDTTFNSTTDLVTATTVDTTLSAKEAPKTSQQIPNPLPLKSTDSILEKEINKNPPQKEEIRKIKKLGKNLLVLFTFDLGVCIVGLILSDLYRKISGAIGIVFILLAFYGVKSARWRFILLYCIWICLDILLQIALAIILKFQLGFEIFYGIGHLVLRCLILWFTSIFLKKLRKAEKLNLNIDSTSSDDSMNA